MERARRTELDGLRALAALIVLVAHVSNEVKLWGGLLGHGSGKVGVMIFFCLSGYLMGALYLDRKPHLPDLLRYGVHRLSRIAPLYLAVVFVSLVCGVVFTHSIFYGVTGQNLFLHLTFQQGSGVLWTIPVEVQFYVCFAALWIVRSGARWAFILLCAGLIPLLWYKTEDAGRIGSTLLAWAPYFLTGLLVSCIPERSAPSRLMDVCWSGAFVVIAGATLVLFPQIAFAIGGLKLTNSVQLQPWHNPWSYLLVGLLLATTLRAPIARALLGNAPMVYAGAISYSLYLLHMPVIRVLKAATPLEQWPEAFLVAATLLTGLAATLVFHYFEDPVRRRLNRLAERAPLMRRSRSEAIKTNTAQS